MSDARPPCALTIAGSDSGGGAGIQADLKAFAAHGVHGLSAIAALTAQNTRGVTAVHVPPVAFLRAQIDACFEDFRIGAVKLGMLATADVIHAVADALESTGRLITGAAAIMAAVFFGFATAGSVIIQAVGIGIGLAVVIDATIVRALLVPATMRLMGRWNWWAPAPLASLHRRLGLAERSADAEVVSLLRFTG